MAKPREVSEIAIPASAGELIDKLTILEIKRERIADPAKLRNIAHEFERLTETAARALDPHPDLDALRGALAEVNRDLWDVEDALRAAEAERGFGDRFVALARSVYRLNDRRAALKREINEIFGSAIVEEKSYAGKDR